MNSPIASIYDKGSFLWFKHLITKHINIFMFFMRYLDYNYQGVYIGK